MTRTIVETSPGRYQDPDTKRRTSKKDGDQVISKAEYEAKAQAAEKATESKPATEVKTKILSSGKIAQGKTVEITCRKRGCSEKRTIKVQDKFQVKFCPAHQKEHRNELRRQRRQAKAKAAKAAS